jgi:hypothetical protein
LTFYRYRSIATGNIEASPTTDRLLTHDLRGIGETVTLLRKLISGLGDTVDAWNRFQRRDIGYFIFDDELPTNSSSLKCSVNAVDNVFLDLKDILRKLRQMERGLCQDSPQGVSNIFSYWPLNVALC